MNNTRKQITSGLIWRFLERFGAQGVTFIVSVILARLLDPEVYGSLALVTILTSILQVFVDSGLGNALVQKKDTDNIDYSSVFFFNMAMCGILYILLFLAAPYIASFYNMNNLSPVIRVLGLTIIISGLKNVQQAYVTKNLLFKKFFFATLSGTIGAGIIGIYMAYSGYGIWALVIQYLFNHTIDTLMLWITVKWRPQMAFSIDRLKKLLNYGWKLLLASLLETVYNNLRSLVIGKKYSSKDLAFYNRGNYFPGLVASNVSTAADSVLFPSLSERQNNINDVKNLTRRAIKIGSYIMFPLMMGLAVCGKEIIRTLLTDKWLPALPYMRIYCFSYAFYVIHTTNLNTIKSLGRSDIYLRLEIIKKIIGFIVILVTMQISIKAIAYSLIVVSVFSFILNATPNKKLIDYGAGSQMRDLLTNICITIIMGIGVFLLGNVRLSPMHQLLIQIPCGICIYIGLSIISHNDSFYYLLKLIKDYI